VHRHALRDLLDQVSRGKLGVDEALERLRDLPARDLEFAVVDHHRGLRCGFPEVIFAAGKTTEQVVAIARELAASGSTVLATRVSPEQARALVEALPPPAGTHNALARTFVWRPEDSTAAPAGRPPIAVVAAGTSDLPVAEEAAVTIAAMGHEVVRVTDVGVAGIHRLVPHLPTLARCGVVIVVAGMEGALASVVGGLVARPVIAVPTSVGYGASFGGLAALLGMLNSCAAGVVVVNIDNGFGAGSAAARMNQGLDAAPDPGARAAADAAGEDR
jgi:pyridinium-3,5-biscarboxylic acid mononucleotide synthase